MIINLCGQWTANCRAEGQHCSAVSTARPSDTGSWSLRSRPVADPGERAEREPKLGSGGGA